MTLLCHESTMFYRNRRVLELTEQACQKIPRLLISASSSTRQVRKTLACPFFSLRRLLPLQQSTTSFLHASSAARCASRQVFIMICLVRQSLMRGAMVRGWDHIASCCESLKMKAETMHSGRKGKGVVGFALAEPHVGRRKFSVWESGEAPNVHL